MKDAHNNVAHILKIPEVFTKKHDYIIIKRHLMNKI